MERTVDLRKRVVALGAGAALMIGGLAASPADAGLSDCPSQPQVYPVGQLRAGQQAVGLTVSQGRDAQEFDVEILGVLPDGVAPGRDMIVVDVHSPAIDEAGGIWFGMSGSPVYLDNKLVGAVAFGLSGGPSTIGGLTAAEDMAAILDYPNEPTTSERRRVALSRSMRERIAERTNRPSSEIGGSMVRLKVPFSMSGLSGPRLQQMNEILKDERLALVAYAGSSASAEPTSAPGAPLRPGDSFAAALSYGDVTAAGIGTTTLVCNGVGVAFGHPFFFQGRTAMGANAADAITIVDDPLFGPYKLATVEEMVGTVDQDRLAGIRFTSGAAPSLIPIESSITASDLGRSRDGSTRVVDSEFVPGLTFSHLLGNIDSIYDHIGEGSASLSWSISGLTESGSSFTLSRSNVYASEFDIAIDAIVELAGQLFLIYGNNFEDVEFTNVDVTGSVKEKVERYKIARVLVKRGAGYEKTREVFARPGGRIRLQVVLRPHGGGDDVTVPLVVRVPRDARRDGYIEITGGGGDSGCGFFFGGGGCVGDDGKKADSLEDLIAILQGLPQNNDLSAALRLGGRRVRDRATQRLDRAIVGHRTLFVILGGGGGGGGFVEGKPRG